MGDGFYSILGAMAAGQRRWVPWAFVLGAFSLTLVLGLAAGSMLENYDENIGFANEADRIAEVLQIQPGMSVGDVRAGTGRWSVDLARRVGESGTVYATPGPDPASEIYETVAEAGVENVTVIVRTPGNAPRLPLACCDAILLRFVYRSFEDRRLIADSMSRNLKPGGTLAVIDWHAGTPGRNAVSKETALEELSEAGLELVRVIEEWAPHVYCLVFRRSENT
jgi:ubiquinone/menaquinone biosynthesis C-methylase UbiE